MISGIRRIELRRIMHFQQVRFRRRLRWIMLMGLPPPDDRGFVPAREGDEVPARIDEAWETRQDKWLQGATKKAVAAHESGGLRPKLKEPPFTPTWALPAMPDDAPPQWDNVVRAYEDGWEWECDNEGSSHRFVGVRQGDVDHDNVSVPVSENANDHQLVDWRRIHGD